MIRHTVGSILLLLPLLAIANDASNAPTVGANEPEPMAHIRATLHDRYPEANVGSITASKDLPGWYELVVGKEIVYADPTADRLIVGKLVDTKTHENLTQKAWSEAHLIDFKALPFEHSIKTVRGKGERVVAVFEDPLCPFCEKLEQQMQGIDDVTIYRFLLPLESIHPGATAKTLAIWCSNDRAAAWSEWMLNRTEPKAAPCNADSLASVLETAARLNLNSTPTLVFADGHRIIGSMTSDSLEKELQHSTPN